MKTVNMHEAKSTLSKLVEAIESGEHDEIVIARNGKPAVRLVPVPKRAPRKLGLAEGKYADMTLEEFNRHDEEIARLFNDGPWEPERDDDASAA